MRHYKHGGSSAQRTLSCPSWIDEAAKAPPTSGVSEYAAEGTMLHDLMEQMLNGDIDEWPGTVDDDQKKRLNMALDAWDDFCRTYKIDDFLTEQTFEINADTGGTCDVFAWNADRTFIVDWKFGQGVPVEAEGNVQALFYAMASESGNGMIQHDPDTPITVIIIQPIPSRDGNKTLKTWDVPADFYSAFKLAYVKAQRSKGLFTGDHCRWCPAAATCPEKTGVAQAALMADPAQLDELSENLNMAMQLEAWIKSVKAMAHQQLEDGANLPGFKLVAKRATRKWGHPDTAEAKVRQFVKSRKLLVSDITEKVFLTAPKMEKVFKAKGLDFDQLGAYIDTSSSGTTLAREDDPREGVMSSNALKAALGRLN